MRILHFTLSLFFSVFVVANFHEELDIDHKVIRNEVGQPVKVQIKARYKKTPVFDNCLLVDQVQEYHCEQEFYFDQSEVKSSLDLKFDTKKSQFKSLKSQYQNLQNSFHQKNNNTGWHLSVRMAEPEPSAFDGMSIQDLIALSYAQKQYKLEVARRYHMSVEQKDTMMRLNLDNFVKQLLSDETLHEQAVWELWEEYLQGCWLSNRSKFQEAKNSIKQKLKARTSKLEQEVQEHLKQVVEAEKQKVWQEIIEQQYQSFEFAEYELILNDQLQEIYDDRKDALQQTKNQKFLFYDQNYELNAQARGYLQSQNKNYQEWQRCYGTALQQQFHKESCQMIEQAAQLALQSNGIQSWPTAVTHFADGARESNQKHQLSLTEWLSNAGWSCVQIGQHIYDRKVDYAKAVASGVTRSVTEFVHMMTSPSELIDVGRNLGKAIYFILETSALHQESLQNNDPEIHRLWQERKDLVCHSITALQNQFNQMDGPQRVEALTKFGADFYIPGKITGAVGYAFSGVCKRARGLRTLEGAVGLIEDEFGLAELFEETAQAAKEFELATEQGVLEDALQMFMETEKNIGTAGSKLTWPVKAFLEEVHGLGTKGVVPVERKDLIRELQYIVDQANKKVSPLLEEAYKNKTCFVGKELKFSLQHIIDGELKLKKMTGKGGGWILQLEGGHAAGTCKRMEKSGLFTIVKEEQLANGCYHYSLRDNLTGYVIEKTEWPKSWSAQKIAQKTQEAYELGIKMNHQNGVKCLNLVLDGIDVKLPVRVHDSGCNIKSCYPVKNK